MIPSLVTKADNAANLDTHTGVAKMLLVKFIRERSPEWLLHSGLLKLIRAQMQDLIVEVAIDGQGWNACFQSLKQLIDKNGDPENGNTEDMMIFAMLLRQECVVLNRCREIRN
ncbi:hypothetical protein MHU86_6199 [Fragilaria crotonensis]|nr:hypothetical protein MHU86_6199 [Fragilaria crotonensis]